MLKILIFSLLIVVLALSYMEPAAAWAITNHRDIAAETYYAMPPDIQEKLSLKEMQNGSIAPDTKFFDFKYHIYPLTQDKAYYWLEKGRANYQLENYEYASYCYGVATHYIADGLCPPHSESGNSHYYHNLYEARAMFLSPSINYSYSNLDLFLESGAIESKNSWYDWLENGDDVNIQQDLNRAATGSFLAVNAYIPQNKI